MKLTKDQFILSVIEESSKIGINITQDVAEKLFEYKELLLEWNDKINLTAITDDEEIVIKHIVDSLYVSKYITSGNKVIDVGTGAGLPGVILAIYFGSSVQITLFDALNKRINFLNLVIEKLNLKNVIVIQGRAEETSKKMEYREQYDVAVSRAVARLNILMELTTPFVKENGLCIYMKSEKAKEEMAETNNAIKVLKLKLYKIDEYTLTCNEQAMNHNVLLYNKIGKNADKYPRQFAKIKKQPL